MVQFKKGKHHINVWEKLAKKVSSKVVAIKQKINQLAWINCYDSTLGLSVLFPRWNNHTVCHLLPHLVVRVFVIVLQDASKKNDIVRKKSTEKSKKKSLVTYVPWSKVQQGFLRSNSEKWHTSFLDSNATQKCSNKTIPLRFVGPFHWWPWVYRMIEIHQSQMASF